MIAFPTNTAPQIREASARVAVLPMGSYEQHGPHLPVTTDTLIACIIAGRIASDHGLQLLPPVTFGCSHEHAQLGATVSVRARTLYDMVTDIADSLRAAGVPYLVVVNAHGGNYVLANVVQEANEREHRMALFPSKVDWEDARRVAGIETNSSEDMHAGDLETSVLLYAMPEVVRPEYMTVDHDAAVRPLFATVGMAGYTASGVIGRPSAASARKGESLLAALSASVQAHLTELSGGAISSV